MNEAKNDNRWWTLLAVSIATFMMLIDISIVNVALPDIRRELNASFTDLQWVVDAYALTLAAALLAAGSIADLIGRRKVFALGITLFTVSSLACGLAGHPNALNIARAFQGVGGAMIFATSLALIANAFRGPERGTAFGIVGAVIGGAVSIGPLVGGLLTDSLGWEWIFFVNVPIGVIAVALTQKKVSESREPHDFGIDWTGVALFSIALFLLVLSLIKGNDQGWTSTRIVLQLVVSVLLLVAFLIVEHRREHPLFDLQLFRKPAFNGASIAGFAISAGIFSLFLYITLYLQNFLGYSALEAGVRLLPVQALSFVIAPLAGKLTATIPHRWFLGSGLMLVAIGVFLMAGITETSSWTYLIPGFVIGGIGIGMCNPPLAATAVGVVPPERSGMGSGINATFRQVGIATGIAGLGAIFQAQINDSLTGVLGQEMGREQVKEIGRSVTSGAFNEVVGTLPAHLQQSVAEAGKAAFVSGYHTIFVIAGIVSVLGAILSFVLVRPKDFVPQGHGENDS